MAIAEITSQRCSTVGSSQTNVWTITYPATPTQGNLLVVGVVWRNDLSVLSVSTGWNLASVSTGATDDDCAIYYKIAGASEPTTFSITLSGNSKSALVGTEFSGVNQTTPLDRTSTNFGSGTAGTTGSIAPTKQTIELVIALYSNINVYTWSGFDNGQSQILQVTTTGASASSKTTLAMASALTSSKTGVNYGATLSTSGTWATAAASFRDEAQVFVDVNVIGNTGTGQIGTVTVWDNEQVNVTGNTASTSLGSVSAFAASNTAASGVSATTTTGDLSFSCAANTLTFGNEAAGIVGDVAIAQSAIANVSGVSATGQIGNVRQFSGLVVRVTGVSAQMPQPLDVSIWFGVDDEQTPNWVLVPAY